MTSLMLKIVLVLFFLLFPWDAAAAEDPKVRNLQGISALQVIVERPTADALEAGITEEAVRKQVQVILQSSLPLLALDKREGPSLYVRVALYKRQKEDLYYGMINVSVDRAVLVLSLQGNFPAFSQVWENTVVYSGRDPLLGTYELIAKLLNLLIKDFREANP